jgi:hypothetical protein
MVELLADHSGVLDVPPLPQLRELRAPERYTGSVKKSTRQFCVVPGRIPRAVAAASMNSTVALGGRLLQRPSDLSPAGAVLGVALSRRTAHEDRLRCCM